jgi:hypothetical protein
VLTVKILCAINCGHAKSNVRKREALQANLDERNGYVLRIAVLPGHAEKK